MLRNATLGAALVSRSEARRMLDGKAEVRTLKLDLQFWPTLEFRRTDTGWERIEH